jgi:hypothetical protein
MSTATSLRIERIPARRGLAGPAPGPGTGTGGQWVIYSGPTPVLRCEDETVARSLVAAVEERLALRAAR